MQSRQDALTRRERLELEGLVAWWLGPIRVAVSLLPILLVGYVSWRALSRLSVSGPWWLLPPGGLALVFLLLGRRWTGGRLGRKQIRADLAANSVRVLTVNVLDAIKIEEVEDEGAKYFLRTEDGSTLTMGGQYLYPYEGQGFPWTVFEIRESAHSHVFLGLRRVGEKLKPNVSRRRLLWKDLKRFGLVSGYWKVINVPFDDVSRQLNSRSGESSLRLDATRPADGLPAKSKLTLTPSGGSLWVTGILCLLFTAFCASGLYAGYAHGWFTVWGCRLGIAFFPLALLDFVTRRYQFEASVIRYRACFRWRSVPVTQAISLWMNPTGSILIKDAATGRTIIELEREFVRGDWLAEEVADFYRKHDCDVLIR